MKMTTTQRFDRNGAQICREAKAMRACYGKLNRVMVGALCHRHKIGWRPMLTYLTAQGIIAPHALDIKKRGGITANQLIANGAEWIRAPWEKGSNRE